MYASSVLCIVFCSSEQKIMWQCFVQFMEVICFISLLVWDAKSDWAEEPVLLTPLESILELLLIFLQISSGFFVTRIFTVLDAYGLVAVIQLKLLHPENTGIPRWFLPVLIIFFFPPFVLLSQKMHTTLGKKWYLSVSCASSSGLYHWCSFMQLWIIFGYPMLLFPAFLLLQPEEYKPVNLSLPHKNDLLIRASILDKQLSSSLMLRKLFWCP